MKQKITIREKSAREAGFCNFCTNYTEIIDNKIAIKEHKILEIESRSISFRVCDKCRKKLIKGLSDKFLDVDN